MIPEYCYDCMNRQPQMNFPQGTTSMMQGYPMQGMYKQSGQGTIQMPMQQSIPMPMQMPMQVPFGSQAGGSQTIGQLPLTPTAPVDFGFDQGPPVQTDTNYTQGWLRTQIGKRVKIEFLLGTNSFTDREGTLLDVGISYVLLREAETDDILTADMYSIKFVRVYQ